MLKMGIVPDWVNMKNSTLGLSNAGYCYENHFTSLSILQDQQ